MHPWDLSLFPNYDAATAVDHVAAHSLSAADFIENYVKRSRPCVIEGAASRWPALRNWTDPAYLTERCGGKSVLARLGVVSLRKRSESATAQGEQPEKPNVTCDVMPFADFLRMVWEPPANGAPDSISIKGMFGEGLPGMNPPIENNLFAPLIDDITEHPFCARLKREITLVPAWRAFLGRQTYTDWHYHTFSEQILTQVLGTKEILLLPDGRATFRIFGQITKEAARRGSNLYGDELARAVPEVNRLLPAKARLDPGNALYIPNLFWHAVMARSDGVQFSVVAAYDAELNFGIHRPGEITRLNPTLKFASSLNKVRLAAAVVRGYARSFWLPSNDWFVSAK